MIDELISGGQYGADEAGLDVAFALGIPTGGFATKGFKVQNFNGTVGYRPELGTKFGLVELDSDKYPDRTKANVEKADGTVLYGNLYSPGSKLVWKLIRQKAKRLGILTNKILLTNPTSEELYSWLVENDIKTLNVAGNRHSPANPTIYHFTYDRLYPALSKLCPTT